MNTDNIKHLAELSRLELTPEDVETLTGSLPDIVEYIGAIREMTETFETEGESQKVGDYYNVFRQDEVTVEADSFTEDIFNNMPKTDGRWLQVKKILKAED